MDIEVSEKDKTAEANTDAVKVNTVADWLNDSTEAKEEVKEEEVKGGRNEE